MATSQTEIESRAVELSTEAFEAFCDDISGMFGVDMGCEQDEVCVETVKGLKKRFKKLVVVNSVKAEGALEGTFQLIFDQGGLFILPGVIVMLPEQKILEEIEKDSIKDIESMNAAVKEAGNMLVGAWDRVFHEGLDGHGRFAQSDTFIGAAWDKPEETIGLAGDEEFVFVPYEITIKPYPAFKCGVIFPKTIFKPTSESDVEEAVSAEEKTQEKTETGQVTATEEKPAAAEKVESEESDVAQEDASEKPEPQESAVEEAVAEEGSKETVETDESASADKPEPAKEKPEAKEAGDKKESAAEEKPEAAVEQTSDDVDTNVAESVAEKETTLPAKSEERPISETIRKMTDAAAVLPGESNHISLAMCAKDVMEKEIVWGSGEDSVEQVLAKMQQADVGYIMVGQDGVLEGIVSKSDLTGAVSPYLRPVFAKWRRPLDDATLQIKIKWIMSRPVNTIKPDMSLEAIMENMCRFGQRALPVMDEQDKVQGLVTMFGILQALLGGNPNISSADKTPQAPPST